MERAEQDQADGVVIPDEIPGVRKLALADLEESARVAGNFASNLQVLISESSKLSDRAVLSLQEVVAIAITGITKWR